MDFLTEPLKKIEKSLKSDFNVGLTQERVKSSRRTYGANALTEKKPKSIVKRLIEALLEPMMLILSLAFVITSGVNIGKVLRGGDGDFYECIGIFIAITISVVLTVVMEVKSERAFRMLKKLGGASFIRAIRGGKTDLIKADELVVGDIVFLDAGNKIPADGRLISSENLYVDESTLTGESLPVCKDAAAFVSSTAPLAERYNFVFSGTYVERGVAKYIVTAVGDNAEIGHIAEDLTAEKSVSAPLNEKLSRLGRMVTVFGVISSLFVFILSLVRLLLSGSVTFDGVQDIFIRSVVLIVAAVPEGLPTTVAISLTLNVLRLAKSNALIRKLVATETVGAVSVICTDKTGTLTKNKMSLIRLVTTDSVFSPQNLTLCPAVINAAVNSTADLLSKDGKTKAVGSATEAALLSAMAKCGLDYVKIRKSGSISLLTPFSSQTKYMETSFISGGKKTVYLKGSPEVVTEKCLLSERLRSAILDKIRLAQTDGARVIAFASSTENGVYSFDGYAVIADGIRDDIAESVLSCQRAGVAVKMLTGDNKDTARRIAMEAGILRYGGEVVTADYIESLSDEELKLKLPGIAVIARSTPKTKLRVVTSLQSIGEVVAVTGDGVNDAPAIKHADIGIAMGDGSEITKNASDIVLMDNSFSTILTAINFGRNVYSNFRRFIMFQLTVNLASMTIIIVSLILGMTSPFSGTCLLWLNIIMDGPLALSLGLELRNVKYMSRRPVRRSDDILNGRILFRIGLHATLMCLVVTLQRMCNFLGAAEDEELTVVITMFVFFQVFNAVNCREVSSASALKGITDNKLLLFMIFLTYALHVLIVTFVPGFFGTVSLSPVMWIKITAVCLSIIVFSEAYKCLYRLLFLRKQRAARGIPDGVKGIKGVKGEKGASFSRP